MSFMRSPLVDIYTETKKIAEASSHGLDPKLTKKMVDGTKAYRFRKNGNLMELGIDKDILAPSEDKQLANDTQQTTFQVLNQDSFVVAKQLLDKGLKPL